MQIETPKTCSIKRAREINEAHEIEYTRRKNIVPWEHTVQWKIIRR